MPPRSADPSLARSHRSRAAAWIAALLGLLVLFTAFVAVFDWTWCRPLIQHFVQQRSGRQIDFDRLQLGLDRYLAPTVRLQNLRVQNASWAAAASMPMIQAEDFSATFDPASLLHGDRIVITRMTLVGADIDLEMQADGLRNWRLTRPEDRGPGRVRVLTIDAQRSRLQLTHQGLQLALQLQSDPLAASTTLPGIADLPLTQALTVHGTRGEIPFDGRFELSDVISLYDTARTFALRGSIGTRTASLSVTGQARDLLQFGGFDADVRASGTPSADLAALLGRPLPSLPALATEISAHARKDGSAWSATQLVAHLGHSDLSGSVDYRATDRDALAASATGPAAAAPAQLRATLTSQRIALADWRGAHAAASSATPAAPLDAQVDWQVDRIDGLPLPVRSLRTHAAWRDERLTLAPLALVVAGGAASGQVSVAAASSSATLQLDGLQLDQLGVRDLAGRLNARVALQSRGASVEAMLAALTGTAEAELQSATLPATLDAKLGLDGGRWLRALVKGQPERSAVRCSSLKLRFDQGIGTFQRLALETETVLLNGSGSIDLPHRRVAISLTPHRKQSALFALDDSIRVDSAWSAPTISLAHRSGDAAPAVGCLGAPHRPAA
jgi:uncharacterized protein involved in outer membrane biogenesis